MMSSLELVERRPTVEEYSQLVAAVGWRARDVEAVSRALEGPLFAVCAESGGVAVGMGRIPFKNAWVRIFAVEGTAEFYARFGYKAQRPSRPAMSRWLNRSEA